jgi:3-oxoadipate enol-lactonase
MQYRSVLLIPTLAFATASWDAVASRLPRDVICRRVALPGHGAPSSIPGWDIVDMSAELATWAEACPRPPHVIGSGIGAMVAENLARMAPTASLTVIGWPPDQRPGELRRRITATRLALGQVGNDEFLTAYRAGAAPRASTAAVSTPVSTDAFIGGLEVAAGWMPAPLPRRLPVTVIRGAGDLRCRPVDAQALANLWGADFHEVPGAGHATYVDAPVDVARLLIHVICSAERASRPPT